MTKALLISAWVLATWVADELGRVFNQVSGWFDWAVLGWAFGGSTVFVVVEVMQRKKRKGWHRLATVCICVFLSVSPINAWAAKKLDADKEMISVLIGLFGYPFLIKQYKKVDKSESIEDFKP